MPLIEVGQRAPSFRLPSGQGGEIGLDDYRGRHHVLVWFTKGMGCPFCRSQMSQLARGQERLRALGAEVLQITPTPPSRAAFYARSFTLPYAYLCDPDYAVHRQWGVDGRAHWPGWYAGRLLVAMQMAAPPPSDLGNPRPTLAEMRSNLADTDMGFFLVDRAGVVRWAVTGAYGSAEGIRRIPSTDEIVQQLQRAAA
jgi:peroxiredoxin